MSEYLRQFKKHKKFHCSLLEPQMTEYLHTTTLKMLRIIIPIFDRYNIRYMICGGTLLGAVTTGKFIPWDDDVDICVLEDDYDVALERLAENIPDWIFLQIKSTESQYYHGWAKIRDKNSKVYPSEEKYKYNGVWIDVYKLTKTKIDEVGLMTAKEHMRYLTCRFRERAVKRIISSKLISRIAAEKLKSMFSKNKNIVYVIGSASRIAVNPEWIFPLREYCFEGIKVNSFNNPSQYLIAHYGKDYHILPPSEMRRIGINRIEVL